MAINQNHTIEELNGVRCSIIERSITQERVVFITSLLKHNKLECIVADAGNNAFTVGVTKLSFNLIHELYARKLKTTENKIVTPSFWKDEAMNFGFYWENRGIS